MKYRKKPIVIEAIQYTGQKLPMVEHCWDNNPYDKSVTIQTLEGRLKVSQGDFIIQGIKGEYYPCKPDIFEATYEPVNELETGTPKRDIINEILCLLEVRVDALKDDVKEHGAALNTKGASYDIGALDEAIYIKEQIMEIIFKC